MELDVFYVSTVVAPHPSIAPTFNLVSSDAFVVWSLPNSSMVLPVVLPPNIMGDNFDLIFDPYVFTAQCFLPSLMVDRIYIWGRVNRYSIVILGLSLCCHFLSS